MNRILVITKFSKPWHNGHYIVKALHDLSYTVSTFDPLVVSDKEGSLFQLIDDVKPEMILLIKPMGMNPEWFEHIRKKGALIVMWYPDPLILNDMLQVARKTDFFFTMAEGLISEYRHAGIKRVFFLSQGFEPSFFQIKNITEEERKIFSSDISFIGNIDTTYTYIERRDRLKKILSSGFHLKWWGPRLGRKLKNLPLMMSALGRAYGGKFVYGEEYAKVVKLSRIILAFDRAPQIKKSMSARMYTAVGCGAFYMCQYVDGIEDFLVPGKEIVTFNNNEEMLELIRYFMHKDEERKKISERGQMRVLNEHTYRHRLAEMLDLIKKEI